MLNDFDFDLPKELIAQYPINRGKSKLLYRSTNEKLTNKEFSQIYNLLQSGDVLVLNNTRVIPSCLTGYINGIELKINLINRVIDSKEEKWEFLSKPRKKVMVGAMIKFSDQLIGVVLEKFNHNNMDVIEFFKCNNIENDLLDDSIINDEKVALESNNKNHKKNLKHYINSSNSTLSSINQSQIVNHIKLSQLSQVEFFNLLYTVGVMPLPPYMKRNVTEDDKYTYQTVFSKVEGSVAAPTAGLHFTDELLAKLQSNGVKIAYVTLHIGGGTFLPVRDKDISQHKMHSEFYSIDNTTCDIINNAKSNNNRVIAVGTTVTRTLESAAEFCSDKKLYPHSRYTNIFIKENYKFKVVDCLITNFHLPKSTLFMLVCSFLGSTKAGQELYNYAINNKYRFFSYGDACFLER